MEGREWRGKMEGREWRERWRGESGEKDGGERVEE